MPLYCTQCSHLSLVTLNCFAGAVQVNSALSGLELFDIDTGKKIGDIKPTRKQWNEEPINMIPHQHRHMQTINVSLTKHSESFKARV